MENLLHLCQHFLNDPSRNGRRPLQLLIKAQLEPRMADLGVDIDSTDKSGLMPYQVAISKGDKSISDLLRSKGACPMSPPDTGYAQHYKYVPRDPISIDLIEI